MSSLLHHEIDTGDTIYYSLVDKQSQKGFSSHRRLFVMLENKFVCYLREPTQNIPFTYEHITRNTKTIVPLTQIKRLNFKNQSSQLQIYFWVYEENKRINKHWVFKMENPHLLYEWQCAFDQYTNRSRKATIESRNIRAQSETIQQALREEPTQPQYFLSPEERQLQDRVAKEMAQSRSILQEPNESFFARYRLGDESLINSYSSGKTNQHQTYFCKIGEYNSFKNYYRPYLQDLFDLESSTSRETHLQNIDKQYQQFVQYATLCVKTLIDSQLPQLIDTSLAKWNVNGRPSTYSGWIRYEEIDDVTIDFGLVQMRNIGNQTYVCDQGVSQIIEGIFTNMDFIYQAISQDPLLRRMFSIPMSCMVNYKGHQCLVRAKIDPKVDQEYDIGGDLVYSKAQLFQRLASATKVQLSHLQDEDKIIFKTRNRRKDRFAITEVRSLLPELEDGQLLRKQALNQVFGLNDRRVDSYRRHQFERQNHRISEYLSVKMDELSDLMNKLEVYPISPQQMNHILHSFGLGPSFIGKIFKHITQPFVQGLLKTEVAVRSFAPVFARKMQQTLSKSDQSSQIQTIGLELINALLGKGQDHIQLWRLVKLHSQNYFGLSVNPQEVNKGYFFMALSYHLIVELFPASYNVEHIFQMGNFLEGLKYVSRVQVANILPSWLRQLQEKHEIPISASYFAHIISLFDLQKSKLPFLITVHNHLNDKLTLLISYFVKPRDIKFKHLDLYQSVSENPNMTRYYLERKMTQLRWEIKDQIDKQYVLVLLRRLRQHIMNHYGLSHPFLSELLDFQSLYSLQLGEEEQAITLNRESLSNILQCCGNNQQELKLSNSYFHFAQCLSKCHRYGEALNHLRKAKHILQVNSYTNRPEYAYLLYRIGKLSLLQNKDNESYEYFSMALKIYEFCDFQQHWDQLVDIYQSISRCQVTLHGQFLQGLKLAQHCLAKLSRVIEGQGCSDQQFIRIFKIIIQEYLRRISHEDSSILRDYLIQLADQLAIESQVNHNPDKLIQTATNYFKQKISEGVFLSQLQSYLMGSGQILHRIKHENKLGVLREKGDGADNFEKFMRRLMVAAGEWFILNTIQ